MYQILENYEFKKNGGLGVLSDNNSQSIMTLIRMRTLFCLGPLRNIDRLLHVLTMNISQRSKTERCPHSYQSHIFLP